jgi:hypothetical protein
VQKGRRDGRDEGRRERGDEGKKPWIRAGNAVALLVCLLVVAFGTTFGEVLPHFGAPAAVGKVLQVLVHRI